MPLTLSQDEHTKLFESHEAPAPLLDLVGAFTFRMVSTALKLGVFEVFREGPRSAAEAAGLLGVDGRGLGLLLHALASNGYLARDGEMYAATPMTEKWLLGDGAQAMMETIGFYDTLLVHQWRDLEDSIRQGEPPRDYFRWLGDLPDTLRQFQTLLSGVARQLGDKVAELAGLPETAERLLDVGGGHALYAAAFCRRHPELHATIFDLPAALEAGRENVAGSGLEDRVHFRGGDLLRDDLGGGYDAVLLASMVHCFLPEENVRLLRRVREALSPGGVVVISEQLAGTRPGDPLVRQAFLQMFSLNLYHLMGGQLYPLETIAGWLADSGFEVPSVHPVGETSFTLLVARRAD